MNYMRSEFEYITVYERNTYSYIPTYRIHTDNDVDVVDEIEDYWNAHYLSAGEAVWCILGFNLTKKEPSVSTITIHLPISKPPLQHNVHTKGQALAFPVK